MDVTLSGTAPPTPAGMPATGDIAETRVAAMNMARAIAHGQMARAVWLELGCAPLVLEGPALARAKRHFLRRAAALGHRRTHEPGLRVLGGAVLLCAERAGAHWRVALPPGVAEVRLISRIWVPAHMRAGESDTRTLGVAIARMALDGREIALDSPALSTGWHPPEPAWRWTDGAAVVPVAGARTIAFEVAMAGEYWRAPVAGVDGPADRSAERAGVGEGLVGKRLSDQPERGP